MTFSATDAIRVVQDPAQELVRLVVIVLVLGFVQIHAQ